MRKVLDFIKKIWDENQAGYARMEAEKQRKIFASDNHQAATIAQSEPIDDYSAFRQRQADWLEQHYDLNTVHGVNSIPASANLPKMPGSGSMDVTGDVDYYLRQKASHHEKNGNIGLAIACLKKSNEIRRIKKTGYRKGDYYALVRLLARNGYIEEAHAEKAAIDRFFGEQENDALIDSSSAQAIRKVLTEAKMFDTDLVIMNAFGATCSECAKYQGRVFSLSGKSKIFPKIPDEFYMYGAIHEGCSHQFYPYIHGCNNPDLDYTLQFYRGIKPRYKKDIVAFSNRPFVDDRPPEEIAKAEAYKHKMELEAERRRLSYERAIVDEARRGEESRTYTWIQENLPDICPKSLSGFRRMKTQNTANYQKIVAEAAKLGYKIK